MTEENRLVVVEDSAGQNRWDTVGEVLRGIVPWAFQPKPAPAVTPGGAKPSELPWGLKTLKEGLDGFARTIVVEPRYICKDHRNLHSNFYSKKFRERPCFCSRLHFFSKAGITPGELLLGDPSLGEHYIGYSVIRPVHERCLGRTVIDPHRVGRDVKDGFFTLRTAFKTHVNGQTLTAHGYPYMSQDGEATVCAHTALWGLCRYLSERYTVYPEVYPYDLINMTSDTQGRMVPYRGMTYSDYSRILVNFGCHPEIVPVRLRDTDPNPDPERFQQLCAYVESGFPVLASFAGHVVMIVGHTMDRTMTPQPDAAGLVDSSGFLKQFIVIDDNFFPYQLLGSSSDVANYGQLYEEKAKNKPGYDIGSIRVTVCPLPEKVYLPASKARELFRSLLRSFLQRPEVARLVRKGGNEALVTRSLVTTSTAFKRRKLEKGVENGRLVDPFAKKIAEIHLPHFVWLMEIAPLSHYLKGRCTGEIVLDATASSMEHAVLYARTGDILELNGQKWRATTPASDLTTFEQYTHNLGEL